MEILGISLIVYLMGVLINLFTATLSIKEIDKEQNYPPASDLTLLLFVGSILSWGWTFSLILSGFYIEMTEKYPEKLDWMGQKLLHFIGVE